MAIHTGYGGPVLLSDGPPVQWGPFAKKAKSEAAYALDALQVELTDDPAQWGPFTKKAKSPAAYALDALKEDLYKPATVKWASPQQGKVSPIDSQHCFSKAAKAAGWNNLDLTKAANCMIAQWGDDDPGCELTPPQVAAMLNAKGCSLRPELTFDPSAVGLVSTLTVIPPAGPPASQPTPADDAMTPEKKRPQINTLLLGAGGVILAVLLLRGLLK